MLSRPKIPGLFITGTDTGVGKTLVAGAIARHLHERGLRVGVFKPVATGCVKRREGIVSEDAEFLAHHAASEFSLNQICPQRYLEPLAPAVAAERAKEPMDWGMANREFTAICANSEVIIVEGVGGLAVPLDRKFLVLDLAAELKLPAVVVARPTLGTINHTLLTVMALRHRKVSVAGVVINNYPAETPDAAVETSPRAIEKWGKVAVLCLVPPFEGQAIPDMPEDVMAVINSVDWLEKAKAERTG